MWELHIILQCDQRWHTLKKSLTRELREEVIRVTNENLQRKFMRESRELDEYQKEFREASVSASVSELLHQKKLDLLILYLTGYCGMEHAIGEIVLGFIGSGSESSIIQDCPTCGISYVEEIGTGSENPIYTYMSSNPPYTLCEKLTVVVAACIDTLSRDLSRDTLSRDLSRDTTTHIPNRLPKDLWALICAFGRFAIDDIVNLASINQAHLKFCGGKFVRKRGRLTMFPQIMRYPSVCNNIFCVGKKRKATTVWLQQNSYIEENGWGDALLQLSMRCGYSYDMSWEKLAGYVIVGDGWMLADHCSDTSDSDSDNDE